jgi:hypothetical protein
MVGDRNGSIADSLSPSNQLKRYQFAIAEDGMCMQINHSKKIQE